MVIIGTPYRAQPDHNQYCCFFTSRLQGVLGVACRICYPTIRLSDRCSVALGTRHEYNTTNSLWALWCQKKKLVFIVYFSWLFETVLFYMDTINILNNAFKQGQCSFENLRLFHKDLIRYVNNLFHSVCGKAMKIFGEISNA